MNKRESKSLTFYLKFFIFVVCALKSVVFSASPPFVDCLGLPSPRPALGAHILKEQAYYETIKDSFKSLTGSLSQFVEGSTDSNGIKTPRSPSCSGILFRNNLIFFNRFKEACTAYIELKVHSYSFPLEGKYETDFSHFLATYDPIADEKTALCPLIFQGIVCILTDIKEWSAINTENITRHNDLVGQQNADIYVDGKKQKSLCPIGLQGTINIGVCLRDFIQTYSLAFYSFLTQELPYISPSPNTSNSFFDKNDEEEIRQRDSDYLKAFNLIVNSKPEIMMVLQKFEQALEILNSAKQRSSSKKHTKKKKDIKSLFTLDLSRT